MSQTNSIFSLVSRGIATFVLLACISTLSLKTLAFDNSSNIFNPQLELSGIDGEVVDINNDNLDDGSFQIAAKHNYAKLTATKKVSLDNAGTTQCKFYANIVMAGSVVSVLSGLALISTGVGGSAGYVVVIMGTDAFILSTKAISDVCPNAKASLQNSDDIALRDENNLDSEILAFEPSTDFILGDENNDSLFAKFFEDTVYEENLI